MSASGLCVRCAAELMPESTYCHACGALIESDGRTGEPQEDGERKPITVLFVDAFGSLGLAAPTDPERWLEIVEKFFSIVSVSVRRFGGTIDRLTGEGIKLLFGAPVAQENHARQACHAALHLASALTDFGRTFATLDGADFSVRMGINSGEVVFGRIGTGCEWDFTSQGHVAALAARLEQLAEPGKIYLTESTAGLVAGFFELREVGTLPIRGASSSVRVYELLRATEHRSRLDLARDRLSPFVGREREMAELDRAFAQARAGSLRIVGLVGEPGVGKSRLCEELAARLTARGAQVHRVRCVEHGRSVPFHAALPFLRSALGVDDDDPADAKRERIASRLRELDPALLDALPTVLEAFGLGERPSVDAADAGGPVRDLTRVSRKLVEAGGADSPSVVMVDDAQWMDAASDGVIAAYLKDPPPAPSLLLATYRPGFQRPWMALPEFRELTIAPLAPLAAIELARSLLGHDASLGALAERLADRAGGNPYFVEEMVQALVEKGALEGRRGAYILRAGAADVSVPPTLQALLAARVDQLADDDKAILQAAAVIGPEFPVPLLRAVCGLDAERVTSSLASLDDAGFVCAADEAATYCFRHPLLQESVYRSLLRERRSLMHRAVARGAERVHPPGVSGQPASLAFHYEQAGDRDDAARWHAHAARAAARRDPAQAVEHWRRVRALTGDDPDRTLAPLRLAACEAILRLGPHGNLGREEAISVLLEGRRLAAQLGDARTTASLISMQGVLLGAAGDLASAIAHNREALDLATALHDDGLALLFGARLVLAHRIAGELDAARAVAGRILDAAGTAAIEPGSSGAAARYQLELARAATTLDLGEIARGASLLDALLGTLRRDGDRLMLAWVLAASALVMRLGGEPSSELVARVEEGLAIARHLELPGTIARSLASLCATRLCEARWTEARDLARAAAESIAGEPGALYVDANCAMLLAEAYLGLGDAVAALPHAREALGVARSRSSTIGEIDASLVLGRVLLEIREPTAGAEARSLLEGGLTVALRCRLRSREPHLRVALAALARRSGDVEHATRLEQEALQLWRTIGATGYAARFVARGDLALSGSGA